MYTITLYIWEMVNTIFSVIMFCIFYPLFMFIYSIYILSANSSNVDLFLVRSIKIKCCILCLISGLGINCTLWFTILIMLLWFLFQRWIWMKWCHPAWWVQWRLQVRWNGVLVVLTSSRCRKPRNDRRFYNTNSSWWRDR